MQPRQLLEEALAVEICEHHHQNAHDLINILLRPTTTLQGNQHCLHYIDGDGKSLLYIALEAKNHDIADRLLSLQDDIPEIMFAKTKTKSTLIHCVAQSGDSSHLTRLVERMRQLVANGHIQNAELLVDGKFWLHADHEGMTPLALAVAYQHYECVNLLITLCKEEDNAALILAQVNSSGENLLHLAFSGSKQRLLDGRILNALMAFDGDFVAKNNKGVSPIQLYCELSSETQLMLFRELDKKHQATLIKHYHDYVATHDSDLTLRSKYFALTKTYQLKAHLIALHEFDSTLPLRSHYKKAVRVKDEEGEHGEIVNASLTKTEFAKNQLPRYLTRLFIDRAAKKTAKRSRFILDSDSESDTDESQLLLEAEWFLRDVATLNRLIGAIENQLPLVEAQGTRGYDKALAISLPIACAMVFVGLTSLFGVLSNKSYFYKVSPYSDKDEDQELCGELNSGVLQYGSRRYRDAKYSCENELGYMALIYGVLAFVTAALSVGGPALLGYKASPFFWNKIPDFSPSEWQWLKELDEDVVARLQVSASDVQISTLQSLTEVVAVLKQTQPKQVAVEKLKEILRILKEMRTQIETSKKPFADPLPESLIEIGDEGDERVGLLDDDIRQNSLIV